MKYKKGYVKNNPFKNHIRKYLEITLIKEVKHLYAENYKTLIKETEDDSKKWKDILCPWVRRFNIAKMALQQKLDSMYINDIRMFPHTI